ncbi:MAG: hypothetical protein KGI71_04295 [Patescibacteria group bacterium]|nr:hypothetical protein [Patescibacteria group bacterium]
MNGLWILPTRRRVSTLKRFFAAAVANGLSTPGRVLVNQNELQELRDEYATVALPDGWEILPSPFDSICETNRGALPLYKHLDWVGLVTDDVVPETPDWDRKLLEWHDGRTVVTCDDGTSAPKRMCGAHIFPMALCRVVGFWVPSGFHHMFVDDLWEDLYGSAGAWRVRMDVVVRHLHPWITGKVDDTHNHSYREDRKQIDLELYRQWKFCGARDRVLEKLRAHLAESKREAA